MSDVDDARADLRDWPEASDPAPGQAAREAWEAHWATAVKRGRGKPGYDEQADTTAGWEAVAQAAIVAGMAPGFAAHSIAVKERDTAREDALQLATRLRLAEGERDVARADLADARTAAREMSDEFITWTVTPDDRVRIAAWRRQAGLDAPSQLSQPEEP